MRTGPCTACGRTIDYEHDLCAACERAHYAEDEEEEPMTAYISHRVPFAEYAGIDAVNASALKNMAVSPLYYRHRLTQPQSPTPAMALGTAAHMAILEPDRFADDTRVWDGARRQGQAWDRYVEANAGKTILTRAEADACVSMAAAVRAHQGAADWLSTGRPEVVLRWQDTDVETGVAVNCKARIDWLPDSPGLIDIKTTADPSPRGFARTAANLYYHASLAWYRSGWRACKHSEMCPVKIVAVQNRAPWDVVLYDVPDVTLERGEELCAEWLSTLIKCRETDAWPGADMGEGEQTLWLPAWAMGAAPELDWSDATDEEVH